MSKRKQGPEAKDSIVVEANGSPAQLSPSTADPAEAKRLLAYIHDDRHFSLLRYLFFPHKHVENARTRMLMIEIYIWQIL